MTWIPKYPPITDDRVRQVLGGSVGMSIRDIAKGLSCTYGAAGRHLARMKREGSVSSWTDANSSYQHRTTYYRILNQVDPWIG